MSMNGAVNSPQTALPVTVPVPEVPFLDLGSETRKKSRPTYRVPLA